MHGELNQFLPGDETGAEQALLVEPHLATESNSVAFRGPRCGRQTNQRLSLISAGWIRGLGLERVEAIPLDQRGVQRSEDLWAANPIQHDESAAERDERTGLSISELDRFLKIVQKLTAILEHIVEGTGRGVSGKPIDVLVDR